MQRVVRSLLVLVIVAATPGLAEDEPASDAATPPVDKRQVAWQFETGG